MKDHLEATIKEVAGKISQYQDLLRGLHKLKAERDQVLAGRKRAPRKQPTQNNNQPTV